ncbi:putative 1-acyl-sn-glycerol-3-phosphate acyltransferase [Streptomyces sp. NBRC 110611]|uniref:lysophospholipid acyltransferase family protein n=1 Tax=Streptomyces sp. NBRC 110611 TaxID=1621259 RepID=UPI000855FC7A|nr:lysophospholipid acyltransferase family protein [Streptomyces sp. NBRC 110611]GAU69478.1 putative 1-acyl-sn-glycerol-3-phosphate acyltransferase [Streptomyces sp. NBRC 110611]
MTGGTVNGPWDTRSDCTLDCAAHALPRVPATGIARRSAAFAHRVGRALADGGRMADPARLRSHAQALLDALGIRLEGPERIRQDVGQGIWLEGPEAGGGAFTVRGGGPGTLIVVNHISWLDIPALLAVEPVTLLAKREVGGWPVVGGLARRAGTDFIDRTHPRRLPSTVRELADLLASGRSVAVFPQATTWCTADRGTFRRATFQAALDAGAPVRPVTVAYTQQGRSSTVAAFCGEDTFLASLRRVLAARALTVRITVHPELTGEGLDRRSLAASAERAALGTGRGAGGGGRRALPPPREREGAGSR